MKTLFIFASIFTVVFCSGQKLDYRKMKDTICPSVCGWRDSISLSEIKPKMLLLDTNNLSRKSISMYYEDFANIEYQLFAYTTDSICIRNSAKYSALAAYHDPKNYSACWNAAYAFGVIHDCERMEHYLALYLAGVPRKFYNKDDEEQVGLLRKKCL